MLFKQKKHFLWIFLSLCCAKTFIFGQIVKTSEEISLPNRAEMYAILGKFGDRFLVSYADRGTVSVVFLDENLKKTGDKTIELDRKNDATVIDIFSDKIGFYVAYTTRRKGRDFIKIHRYDAKAKLMDSATVYEWARDETAKKMKAQQSEDNRQLLLHTSLESFDKDFFAVAIQLDSLKTLWARKIGIEDRQDFEANRATDPLQILFSNDATMHLIRQFDNRKNKLEKHRIAIYSIYGESLSEKILNLPNFLCLETKFVYDNFNKRIVGAALVGKDLARAQGYVLLNPTDAPPPVSDPQNPNFLPFDDDFVSLLEKKKITNNKGLENFRLRDLILRRDGGCVVLVERITEQRHQSSLGQSGSFFRDNTSRSVVSYDFYHEDIVAISLHPDGGSHWKSMCYKRQFSQNDGGVFSSYFVSKTNQHIRLMYNDQVERNTTLSEYVLDGDGVNQRRTFFNTDGMDLSIRFRDAVQISANEIVAPSEIRSQLRLVKIIF
ncbi:MAG: hypothetical protein RL757_421 [Bacteroidota bacterium]|jgi:hypothetical protein